MKTWQDFAITGGTVGRGLLGLVLIGLLLGAHDAHAGKTQRWEVSTPSDFMKGSLDQLTLGSDGELHLGCGQKKLGEYAKEIWCSLTGPDGTIYFGTGTPTDVYALRRNAKPVRILSTGDIAVTSLALDARGNLYAGAVANGNIYRLTADELRAALERNGETDEEAVGRIRATAWCKLTTPYVWSLAVDGEGTLFAGSGPSGTIYRIGQDGKPEQWYAINDANVLCLAIDADGSLLAGGSDRGALYRVRAKDDAVVVHEFEEDEVKSLVVYDGKIVIGVNRQKTRRPRATTKNRASMAEFERVTQELASRYGNRAPEPGGDEKSPLATRIANLLAGAIYVRGPEGRVDKMAAWETESVMDLKVDAAGRILAAMAGEARVYRVSSRQYWEMLFDLREQQAMTLALRDGTLAFVGTGNIGCGYAIDANLADEGVFTSEIHDAQFASRWGNLDWRGAGAIELATRSGNTRLPDNLWSTWAKADGSAPFRVTSPEGRYIQLQARLFNKEQPSLSHIRLYMHTPNQKPEMGDVTVDAKMPAPPSKGAPPVPPAKPAAVADETLIDLNKETEGKESDAPALAGSRPTRATTKHRIAWKAADRDGDALVYRLFYQRTTDSHWLPVSLTEPLTKPEYVWETESVPDGWYRVKVVASDEKSNPEGEALTDEQSSFPFKVDNRRPEVLDLAIDVQAGVVTGKARDSLSLVAYLEYAVDGGDWKYFVPADGIFDDREEVLRVRVGSLSPGPHTIAVRATDEEGNIGVETIRFDVPKAP